MKTTKEHGEKVRERILEEIIIYMMRNSFPPSTREIGELVGLKSTSTVHHHLNIMAENGVIDWCEDQPRTIRVPGIRYINER